MFFKALAFDFDSTLASGDRIGPGVREALESARQAGLEKSVARWRRGEMPDLGRAIDRLNLNRFGPEG